MEQQIIANGGMQYMPQLAVAQQLIYLDFDGELTDYNGEILTVNDVEVIEPELSQERIEKIVSELNEKYASLNVIFVTAIPENAEYSTIFIGKTEAFSPYGSFAGLAETIDKNNQNKTDKAFVMLDSTASDEAIISTINHETDHLLGILDHGGYGLDAYAHQFYYNNIYSGILKDNLILWYNSINYSQYFDYYCSSNCDEKIYHYSEANNVLISKGGCMNISSGGVANNTTADFSCCMYISSGGVANDTILDGEAATMFVLSGGEAMRTIISGWLRTSGEAFMYINEGGIANYTTNWYGGVFLSSGGIANYTTIAGNSGYMYVYGGVANNTNINAGDMFILSGGVANNITVSRTYFDNSYLSYQGELKILSSGSANNIVIDGGGMFVSSGGFVSSIIINDGTCYYMGGTAINTIVSSGGSLYVGSGCNVTDIKVEDGAMFEMTLAPDTYITGEYKGSAFELKESYLSGYTVYQNCILNVISATVEQVINEGEMHISHGLANDTVITGRMKIGSGGIANRTLNAGAMYIGAGGIANDTTMHDAYMFIYGGAVATNTNVDSGGELVVSSGGIVNDTTVNSGGIADVSLGGSADGVIINLSGRMNVSSNGFVNGAIVDFGGTIDISNGGNVNNITVKSGGAVSISSNGIVNNLILKAGGKLESFSFAEEIYCSTYVGRITEIKNNVIIIGKSMYIHSSGSVENCTIAGGQMYVLAGGVANDVKIDPAKNGNITLLGNMRISSGGVANSTTVNSGGRMYISSGGVANSTTVDGGMMWISSGGKHTGTLQIANGAVVSAYQGGIIDFTVADRTVDDGYLINNLSFIPGVPTYTITVSANQGNGTYKLAQGAESFTGNITIGDDTINYGSITVNGDELVCGSKSYSLDQVDGNLTLSVTEFIDNESPVLGDAPSVYIYDNYVEISWDEAYDNVGVAGYYVTVDNTVYTVTDLYLQVNDLAEGEHTYSIAAFDAAGNISESSEVYSFSIQYDGNDSFETAVDFGEIFQDDITRHDISGAIEVAEDKDYYSFTLLETSNLKIFTDGAEGGDTIITLYNSDLEEIAYDDDSGYSNYSLIETELQAGTYYVVVNAYRDNILDPYYLTIELNDSIVSDDGNNSFETAVDVGEIFQDDITRHDISGAIEVAEDKDYYSFTLLETSNLKIFTDGAEGGDTIITLYNSDLEEIAYDDDSGYSNYSLIETELHAGTYYVAVNAYSDYLISEYNLTVEINEQDRVEIEVGNEATVASGETINDVSIFGTLRVNGTVNNAILNNNGKLHIYNGGVANNTTVNGSGFYAGMMYISSGGVANSTTVNSGGYMYLSAGAEANNTVIKNSGSAVVSKGGIGNSTSVEYGGRLILSSGGTAVDTVIESGGSMYISSGAKAINTVISHGSMRIMNGAVVQNTVVDHGYIYVSSGAVINNLDLSEYASAAVMESFDKAEIGSRSYMQIYSNAVVNEIDVNSGGRLYFEDTVINGKINMERGAKLLVQGNSKAQCNITVVGELTTEILSVGTLNMQGYDLILDLSQRFVCDGYIIDDLANIINADIVINVSAYQQSGIYDIARNAGEFSDTITIKCGNSMQDLAVGSSVTVNNITYTLAVGEGYYDDMTLEVSNSGIEKTPEIESYIPGTWSTDWQQASEYAEKHNKMIFVCYGDPTQCPYAGYMVKNLFEDHDFLEFAKENLVLAYDVVPNGKNYSGSPSGYLLNSAGEKIASISGFGQNSYDKWMTFVKIWTGKAENGVYVYEDGDFVNYGVSANSILATSTVNVVNASIDNSVAQNYGAFNILTGGRAVRTEINSRGSMYIHSGGIANSTTVNSSGRMNISSGGIANSTRVNLCGSMYISSGGVANSTTVNSGCRMYMYDGGKHTGSLQLESGAYLYVYQGGTIDFTVADRDVVDDYMINNLSLIRGYAAYTITVSADQDFGTYKLAQGADKFTGSITIGDRTSEYGSITINGGVFAYNGKNYSLDKNNGNLTLTVSVDDIPPVMPEISVDITALTTESVTVTATFAEDSVLNEYSFDGQKWFTYVDGIVFENNGTVYFRSTDEAGNVSDYAEYVVDNIVEYAELNGDSSHLSWSKKNPGTTFVSLSDGQKNFEFATEETSIDMFGLETGIYSWQVRSEHSQAVDGNAFEVKSSAVPQTFISESNGVTDFFIGRKNSVWLDKYKAVHNGFINGWTGTKESASLAGKNNITDVFVGSNDANVLVLTDDANGDALFVEDIYSALGDQARFSQIDEIRAGAGDDIIDMTSQKFEYIGDGVKIYGGDGNDILWANSEENILDGDAGNDRIVGGSGNDTIIGGIGNDSLHGGGGNDMFVFGSNFGEDIIEQLSGGKITLCFESENIIWNEEKQCYSDGINSVKIIGDFDVTVNYGKNENLADIGAFNDFVSDKIFTDKVTVA